MAVRAAAAARCARSLSQPDPRRGAGEARWRYLSRRRRWFT